MRTNREIDRLSGTLAGEVADTLAGWGNKNALTEGVATGAKWALCSMIGERFAAHDPAFDNAAFMRRCGF